ncbi:hypothetical protein ABW20_dc0104414 [Dactylellina cionopaga]|nr:hypothetical protein ABW20_dc0104414 [Dactylellina cionopaga]
MTQQLSPSREASPDIPELFVAWDRGAPSPSLVDLLEDHPELLSQGPQGKRLTALVPGCGRGYDVLLFASHGVDAYGLDLTPLAIAEAQKTAEKNYPSSLLSSGRYNFINGDFFESSWLSSLGSNGDSNNNNDITAENGFDLVYDYTFFCSVDPSQGLRTKWAARMAELVKPGGRLICLEFPLDRSLDQLGPPWPMRSEIYKEVLENVGFERVLHVKPRRYLEAGKDSDMIAVWKRE